MKGLNLVKAFARGPRPVSRLNTWTCRQCLQHARRVKGSSKRGYSSESNRSLPKQPRTKLLVALAAGAAASSSPLWWESFTEFCEPALRSGRVASTLAVCINE